MQQKDNLFRLFRIFIFDIVKLQNEIFIVYDIQLSIHGLQQPDLKPNTYC